VAKTAEACDSAESISSTSIGEDSSNPITPGDSETNQGCSSTVGQSTEFESVEEEREGQSLDAGPVSVEQDESAKPDDNLTTSSSSTSSSSSSSSSSSAAASSPPNSAHFTSTSDKDHVSQLPPSLDTDVRLRSSSAGAATRRVSVESGLSPRQREAIVADISEGKKRRWSVDRPHLYNNNNLPQV